MADQAMPGGWFITLDGVDGCGKSTQVRQLVAHLRSTHAEVISVRDPGSTDVGARLRAILLESDLTMHRRTEAMLFMASRCEMVESIIRPALARGAIVVSDRYLLSTVVYQSTGAADESHQVVPAEQLWQLGRQSCGGLDPHMTLLLDLSAETSMRRLPERADRMESRGIEYMSAVRQAYLDQLPFSGGRQVVIDADQSADDVAQQIAAVVDGARATTSS
ncbi:MAG: dTMP kinase [Planctomycetota bacterium]